MDSLTRQSIDEMLAFRDMIKTTMTEEEWNMVVGANRLHLSIVMGLRQCNAIDAAEAVINVLEADTTQSDLLLETRKAVVVLVATEMMGPDFINSLTA
ncbi:MAG: hypothetical protein EOO88_59710 [Pedobacter sp.]|nr:MAG: hypothetical protein EOO88_59710 [Pedobacter sp.]